VFCLVHTLNNLELYVL